MKVKLEFNNKLKKYYIMIGMIEKMIFEYGLKKGIQIRYFNYLASFTM